MKKVERLPTEQGKIFANHVFVKDLYPGYIKNTCNSTRKTNDSIEKWPEDFCRHFLRKDIQMANRHVRRFPTSLALGDANQNHPLHIHQNGYDKKDRQQQVSLAGCREIGCREIGTFIHY